MITILLSGVIGVFSWALVMVTGSSRHVLYSFRNILQGSQIG